MFDRDGDNHDEDDEELSTKDGRLKNRRKGTVQGWELSSIIWFSEKITASTQQTCLLIMSVLT